MPEPILFIITGSRGAGKTTFCARLAKAARAAGWAVKGLLSHAVYEGSLRTAIDAEDLTQGEIQRLAVRSDDAPTPGSRHWKFDAGVLAWGNAILAASTPTDLLVIDELGPLELERERGWGNGLAAIDSRHYAIALVVIRSELIGEALNRWGEAYMVEIDTPEDSEEKARVLSEQLF
jgi:nucleoside-triphosphatase